MSYEKQIWVNGETITANKLNHIEDGIENSNNISVINIEYSFFTNTSIADKTFEELMSAYQNGNILICRLKLKNRDNITGLECINFLMKTNTGFLEETGELDTAQDIFVTSISFGPSSTFSVSISSSEIKVEVSNGT